jgi:hypothetical protein
MSISSVPFVTTDVPSSAKKPIRRFKKNVNLAEQFSFKAQGNQTVAEFIGTGNFGDAWFERQRFEVAQGRREVPLLIDRIYNVVRDPSLPKLIDTYRLKEGGIVFEEVKEGGEVKFSTIESASEVVRIKHHGAGVEYTKDLFVFNELFTIARLERAAGRAFNALLNNIGISPILTYSYGADNITDAADLTFDAAEKTVIKWVRTLEAAITNAQEDESNPRPGPYKLLVAPGDRFMVERVLNRVPQTGSDEQSSAINDIEEVIVYRGWQGNRGKKRTTYSGVTRGTSYLISLAQQEEDFQFYIKQDLEATMGNPDVSRFILEQTVWDTYLGAYAAPNQAVQKIVWPVAEEA